ncbi:toll-like receptor 6 [Mytilus edulis]|uniref:toll-like receptor 6 n=1 Tax=Mytilus edulis TaxID=6550 RepID=UPI0039F0709A
MYNCICQIVPGLFMLLNLVYTQDCNITVYDHLSEQVKIADCSKRGFSEVPHALPRDITVLDLSGNKLRHISNYSFENYSLLHNLSLAKNKLLIIEDHAFYGLSRLKVLNMSENILNLRYVYTPQMLLPLQNLIDLDIRRNIPNQPTVDLYHYPDQAFAVLKKLEFLALDMAPNPIFGIGFQGLKNLKSLTFEFCFLKYLRGYTFENFSSNLDELKLTRCHLNFSEVENNALVPFPNITKIHFEESCMHLIGALNMLSPYNGKTIEILNFRGLNCPIFNSKEYPFALTITSDMMKHLKTICVEVLDLSDNGIVDFDKNSLLLFDRTECLKHLYFKGNRFAFAYGRHMDELKSFFNKSVALKTFDYSYIPVRFKLKEKDFYHQGQDYHVSNNLVYLPRSLEKLSMSNIICEDIGRIFYIRQGSNLTYLDISFGYSNNAVLFEVNATNKVETLVLDGHFHWTLHQIELVNFINVKTLLWRNAGLDEFMMRYPPDDNLKRFIALLRKLRYLERLDISKNSIFNLPENVFFNNGHLAELSLSNNLFQSIPSQITSNNMKSLDLHNNLLSTVDHKTRVWADLMNQQHGLYFRLDGNAFECNCDSLDFIKWIQETKVKLDTRAYKCTLLNGTVITVLEAYEQMHDLFSGCRNSIWLMVSSILIGTGCIMTLLLVIYSRRWNIAILFYRIFRKIVEKKYGKNYTFDVFVSYGGDSIPWIKNYFIPKLEDEWKLKICIKDRDFYGGHSFYDAEAESIENSRHVIFLLTPIFKVSRECLFEIDRVKHEISMQNIENIIVISKDITLKDIPEGLTHIWNYVLFIQWPEDCNDHDLTWQKLRKWISGDFLY